MASIYEALAAALEGQRADDATNNPFYSSGARTLATQHDFSNNSTKDALLMSLAQGFGGGALKGYGLPQIEGDAAKRSSMLSDVLSRPEAQRMEGLKDPMMKSVAPIVLGDMMEQQAEMAKLAKQKEAQEALQKIITARTENKTAAESEQKRLDREAANARSSNSDAVKKEVANINATAKRDVAAGNNSTTLEKVMMDYGNDRDMQILKGEQGVAKVAAQRDATLTVEEQRAKNKLELQGLVGDQKSGLAADANAIKREGLDIQRTSVLRRSDYNDKALALREKAIQTSSDDKRGVAELNNEMKLLLQERELAFKGTDSTQANGLKREEMKLKERIESNKLLSRAEILRATAAMKSDSQAATIASREKIASDKNALTSSIEGQKMGLREAQFAETQSKNAAANKLAYDKLQAQMGEWGAKNTIAEKRIALAEERLKQQGAAAKNKLAEGGAEMSQDAQILQLKNTALTPSQRVAYGNAIAAAGSPAEANRLRGEVAKLSKDQSSSMSDKAIQELVSSKSGLNMMKTAAETLRQHREKNGLSGKVGQMFVTLDVAMAKTLGFSSEASVASLDVVKAALTNAYAVMGKAGVSNLDVNLMMQYFGDPKLMTTPSADPKYKGMSVAEEKVLKELDTAIDNYDSKIRMYEESQKTTYAGYKARQIFQPYIAGASKYVNWARGRGQKRSQ